VRVVLRARLVGEEQVQLRLQGRRQYEQQQEHQQEHQHQHQHYHQHHQHEQLQLRITYLPVALPRLQRRQRVAVVQLGRARVLLQQRVRLARPRGAGRRQQARRRRSAQAELPADGAAYRHKVLVVQVLQQQLLVRLGALGRRGGEQAHGWRCC